MSEPSRAVFFVSDSTGITAETLGNSLLSQFRGEFTKRRVPFIATAELARSVATDIEAFAAQGPPPLVFMTVMAPDVRDILTNTSAVTIDLVDSNLSVLEKTLGQSARRDRGLFHTIDDSDRYRDRMSAVEYSLEHDDGESIKGLGLADVILVAPSRVGKTPTSMYLAVNYGVRTANVPLLEEDLISQTLPKPVKDHQELIFGLTSTPQRLHQIRQERRPNSPYASLQQCTFELKAAESIYAAYSIPFLDSSGRSIEEIAAVIIAKMGLASHKK